MVNAKKITRLRLNNSSNEEFIVVGLVSAEPDYKLTQAINRRFGISLRHMPLLKASDSAEEYSRFAAVEPSGVSYSLVSNRSENNTLFKKLKNIDFLFIVHDPENMIRHEEIVNAARETDYINAVFYMDQNFMKEKNFQLIIH